MPASTSAAGSSGSGSGSSGSSSNSGLIGGVVGGVVGGLALLALLAGVFFLWRRRRSRTGHGWFLCFGTRPLADKEIDWTDFDPAAPVGSSAAGLGLGAAAGGAAASGRRGRKNQGADATLPQVDDDPEMMGDNDYSNSGGDHPDMAQYGGAGVLGAGAAGAGYYNNQQHGDGSYYNNPAVGAGSTASRPGASAASGPSYAHLDPPEVRAQRAQEQAAIAAAAAGGTAAYAMGNQSVSGHSGGSHGYYGSGAGGHRTSSPAPAMPQGHHGRPSFSSSHTNNFYGVPSGGYGGSAPPAYADAPEDGYGQQYSNNGGRRGSAQMAAGAGGYYNTPSPSQQPSSHQQYPAGSSAAQNDDDDDDDDILSGTAAGVGTGRLMLSNPDEDEDAEEAPRGGGKDSAPVGGTYRSS